MSAISSSQRTSNAFLSSSFKCVWMFPFQPRPLSGISNSCIQLLSWDLHLGILMDISSMTCPALRCSTHRLAYLSQSQHRTCGCSSQKPYSHPSFLSDAHIESIKKSQVRLHHSSAPNHPLPPRITLSKSQSVHGLPP